MPLWLLAPFAAASGAILALALTRPLSPHEARGAQALLWLHALVGVAPLSLYALWIEPAWALAYVVDPARLPRWAWALWVPLGAALAPLAFAWAARTAGTLGGRPRATLALASGGVLTLGLAVLGPRLAAVGSIEGWRSGRALTPLGASHFGLGVLGVGALTALAFGVSYRALSVLSAPRAAPPG